ncbi:3-oxo-tetronate kinase [Microvirga roseola]|uniref:3-oxo-tetronate kinase n=1 Tax=Microvirga roseola TaxID=2883126 RepID=UPI001E534C38|nr:3-oxo-tetronate kinase [Microvirga roseola]
MLLGVIADDFTGASDIANTIAKGYGPDGGLRTVQFLGVPTTPAPAGVEAGVISLKSRSIPAQEAVSQSLAALEWLQAQGCRQIVFKYCSTFDSTPQGNIGPVGEALAQRLGVRGVVACSAFPDAGRMIYKGHLFVGDRLLNESGMEHHPLNPMTDADLRRWLGRQCSDPVGLVDWSVISRGGDATRQALASSADQGQRLVIVDALTNDDLLSIGESCTDAKLLTGGSGIALGLPRNFIRAGLARGGQPQVEAVEGPEAILVGSCSRATLTQVETHAKEHPVLPIDVDAVMDGRVSPEDLQAFVKENAGCAPLIFSSSRPEQVAALQARYGRENVASRLEALFAETARLLLASGVRRLVVGGGETSGAVVSALGVRSFHIGPEIDPGVPVLVAADGKGIAMALKSGNFGAPDFFSKALKALSGAHRSTP